MVRTRDSDDDMGIEDEEMQPEKASSQSKEKVNLIEREINLTLINEKLNYIISILNK
jgi:hypothetical protein